MCYMYHWVRALTTAAWIWTASAELKRDGPKLIITRDSWVSRSMARRPKMKKCDFCAGATDVKLQQLAGSHHSLAAWPQYNPRCMDRPASKQPAMRWAPSRQLDFCARSLGHQTFFDARVAWPPKHFDASGQPFRQVMIARPDDNAWLIRSDSKSSPMS